MVRWIIVLMLLLFSCDSDSNPVVSEYSVMSMESGVTEDETPIPCCVYPPEDINLMMAEQQEGNNLPRPMIVGGTQVNPACPNCKYEFMVSLQSPGWFGGHFCGG